MKTTTPDGLPTNFTFSSKKCETMGAQFMDSDSEIALLYDIPFSVAGLAITFIDQLSDTVE